MKQFIYLDTDIVTSIIAQEEKGYITQMSEESETEDAESKGRNTTINVAGSGEAKIWKLAKAEGKLDFSQGFEKEKKNRMSTKDVAEKILHDAAFDIAYDYASPQKVQYDDQSVGEEGECLEIQRVFDYVDFDYLENMFREDGVIDLIKRNEAKGIESQVQEAVQSLNREQIRKKGTEIKKRIRDTITINNQQYEDVHSILKAIRGLIPYSRMLISNDGFLIPLDDQYFRINPSCLGFKYGGMMTCVGMVTNIIGKDTEPIDDKNVFATLQFSVNEMLRAILPTKNDNLCVIHPIAIYYGQ